ncbi:MAG: pyrroline-5-carboxylate reductase [Candidatus Marinimicrobia bacterium]|jgi:pyrroline-5-carboxylate reductase|nr:pyrroline-5-carboxylate reductase [Candidatus Neomarinimicrobiota bacterium]MBT3962155.1 pyrroline-5-carboxylate reductase [Candidatus Neomarinimicrobiota bacterium]MBT4383822.1 pyrroline-5-carboxylate reductase [Candidatus Neomarinimicrobiota bacterium]MBT4635488.1 pyrroline-5-carboxylate reductase [Candidatus Neomarinimicrobiota bacterium]MBT4685248.1 pyrroline-5-carboxylate reductase [Candidatus Neomarinimicrobiota bacterium]
MKIAILGCGNIGTSIAHGFADCDKINLKELTLTRRQLEPLDTFKQWGIKIHSDNKKAVKESECILLTVGPQQMVELLEDISDALDPKKHILVSVVTGVRIDQIRKYINPKVQVVRAMPNTAAAIMESMTTLSVESDFDQAGLNKVKQLFNYIGKTLVIPEELMVPATALGASGLAFFLRAIRAASQGGTEIGFHAEDSILIAAQTAKGAASLLLDSDHHPESEVDKVTTPRGITISGLNQMEHGGFSSAMIKGIVTSAEKAEQLFKDKE